MSDTSQGEGWWQASDGKWYAPEQHPDVQQPDVPQPTQPVRRRPAPPTEPTPPTTTPVPPTEWGPPTGTLPTARWSAAGAPTGQIEQQEVDHSRRRRRCGHHRRDRVSVAARRRRRQQGLDLDRQLGPVLGQDGFDEVIVVVQVVVFEVLVVEVLVLHIGRVRRSRRRGRPAADRVRHRIRVHRCGLHAEHRDHGPVWEPERSGGRTSHRRGRVGCE